MNALSEQAEMSLSFLLATCLCVVAPLSHAADADELRDLVAICKIMKQTNVGHYGERPPELYENVQRELSKLVVDPAAHSTLIQARVMTALEGRQWEAMAEALKELDPKDPWFWEGIEWKMRAHAAMKDWPSLAKDVELLAAELERQPIDIQPFPNVWSFDKLQSRPAVLLKELLGLRRAVSWPEVAPPTSELRAIAASVDHLEKSLSEKLGTILVELTAHMDSRYGWIDGALPNNIRPTQEQLKTLLAEREKLVAASASAQRAYNNAIGDGEIFEMSKGREGRKWSVAERAQFDDLRRELPKHRQMLGLLRNLEGSAETPLPLLHQSGLWFWNRMAEERREQHNIYPKTAWLYEFEKRVLARLSREQYAPALLMDLAKSPAMLPRWGSRPRFWAPDDRYEADKQTYSRAKASHPQDGRFDVAMALLAVSSRHYNEAPAFTTDIPLDSPWSPHGRMLTVMARGLDGDMKRLGEAVDAFLEQLPEAPPDEINPHDKYSARAWHNRQLRLLIYLRLTLQERPIDAATPDVERILKSLQAIDARIGKLNWRSQISNAILAREFEPHKSV